MRFCITMVLTRCIFKKYQFWRPPKRGHFSCRKSVSHERTSTVTRVNIAHIFRLTWSRWLEGEMEEAPSTSLWPSNRQSSRRMMYVSSATKNVQMHSKRSFHSCPPWGSGWVSWTPWVLLHQDEEKRERCGNIITDSGWSGYGNIRWCWKVGEVPKNECNLTRLRR